MQAIQSHKMKTKVIAFICGDLAVTLHIWIAGIIADFGGFMLKVGGTLIIGAAGGIAGMLAKDLYPILKIWYYTKFKTKNKKKP